jgi:hypothetical protein
MHLVQRNHVKGNLCLPEVLFCPCSELSQGLPLDIKCEPRLCNTAGISLDLSFGVLKDSVLRERGAVE